MISRYKRALQGLLVVAMSAVLSAGVWLISSAAAAPAEATATTSISTTTTTTTSTTSTSTSTTPTVRVVGPPVDHKPPHVSGTPLPGDRLTCHPGTWTGIPSFTYRWVRGARPIAGATARTYTVTIRDEAATISCRVTAHDDGGIVSATSRGVVVARRDSTGRAAQTRLLLSPSAP